MVQKVAVSRVAAERSRAVNGTARPPRPDDNNQVEKFDRGSLGIAAKE